MGSAQLKNILASAICVVIAGALTLAIASGGLDAAGVPVFAWAAIVAFGINWLVFVPSFLARTEHYFDLTGSLTYLSVAWGSLVLADRYDARSVLVAVMVTLWAGRLGTFLFRRVRAVGKDGRFDAIKQSFTRFLMTWTLQGLWVTLTLCCALAIITTDEPVDIGVWGVLGVIVWLVGFAVEVVADRQKTAFRNDPANEGAFIRTGLWAWSRHPNYFGEIVLWVGIAVMALPVLRGWQWVALISPVFVFVLLTRISGVPMLAARGRKRWGDDPDYQRYLAHTPMLVPRPPRV